MNSPVTTPTDRYILNNSCKALHYAHSKGLVHRDIKSGNVMITRDKTLKIMDFGLAKFLREYQNNHTQQVGTPFYMSPEQIIGKDIDFRSDLYSLGCMLFECATGTVPFFKGDLSFDADFGHLSAHLAHSCSLDLALDGLGATLHRVKSCRRATTREWVVMPPRAQG